jgi:uncharacterized MAPEG superfamily protein
MTIAYWCVLVAALLPIVAVGFAKAKPDFDNNAPREWLGRLSGWRARAHAAHLNSFEAFPPFAAAVIIAQLMHAPQGRIDLLALVFIAARVAYIALYITDRASLRSVAWTVAMGCVIALFVAGALA